METVKNRRFFLLLDDWTWWAWAVTTVLLALGLWGVAGGFEAAVLLSVLQTAVVFARDRRLSAFPVQLRVAYTLLLLVCYTPWMRWLYWLPAVGTFALVVFGYCLMARVLSLMPWNRREPMTLDLIRRTFLSAPVLPSTPASESRFACAGGLCTIEAQVARRDRRTEHNAIPRDNPRPSER